MTTTPQTMEPDHPAGRVAQGAAVNFVGEVLGVMGPAFYVVVSRLMGAEVFGVYLLAITYVSIMLRICTAGFDKGLMRHVPLALSAPDSERALDDTLGTALRWYAGGSLILVAAVVSFPEVFVRAGTNGTALNPAWWLGWLVLALPGMALANVTLHALRGLSRMWPYVVVRNAILPLSLAVLTLVPVLFGMGSEALVLGYLGSAYVSLGVALWLFWRYFPKRTPKRLALSRRDTALLHFSLPQGVTECLNFLLARVDIIMIAAFFPNRPELVAVYGVAALIAGVVKKVRLAFDNSYSPILAGLMAQEEWEKLKETYRTVARWIFTLFVGLAGTIVLGSRPLLGMFGPEYVSFWLVVPILCAGRLINAAGGPAQATLLMSGRSKLELTNNVLINIGNVVLNLLLIPRYHVYGAALATATSLAVFNAVRVVEVGLLMKVWANATSSGRVALAGGLAVVPPVVALMLLPVSLWSNLIAAAMFVPIYVLALWLTGGGDDLRLAWGKITAWRKKTAVMPAHGHS